MMTTNSEKSPLGRITPLILTLNEAPNIGRTIDALTWAKRIVVVDSGSTDETLAIVARCPAVEVVHRPFDNHADQWNFGLAQIPADWVLCLDADYILTGEFIDELSRLDLDGAPSGNEASFVYCVHGRPLSASLYPPRVILFRRDRATHYNEGHTQRLKIDGAIQRLESKVRHDDWKPLSRWLSSQQNYARKEADFLLSLPKGAATFSQRLRLIGCVTPVLVFFYTLIVKRCLLDGWPGCLYVLQRTLAETMIALEIIDRRLRGRGPNKAAGLGGRLQPLDPIAQQNGTDAKHEAEQS